MDLIMKKKAVKFGDNINTDVILPGKHLELIDPEELGKHAMEGIDPEIYRPMPSQEYNTDVGFIGSSTPERAHYLQLLANNGYKVAAFGLVPSQWAEPFGLVSMEFQSMGKQGASHAPI